MMKGRMFRYDGMKAEIGWIGRHTDTMDKLLSSQATRMEMQHMLELRREKAKGGKLRFLEQWRHAMDAEMTDVTNADTDDGAARMKLRVVENQPPLLRKRTRRGGDR